jgi:3-deoxy-D-manno-octulosonic-acid transferase
MNNFPLTRDFEKNRAVRISDKGALYDIVTELLESPELRRTMGQNAYRLFLGNSGSAEKAMHILEPYL